MDPKSEDVRAALVVLIGSDLERSIAALGYPVGMGIAPNVETCEKAAANIVDRISDKALALLAQRNGG